MKKHWWEIVPKKNDDPVFRDRSWRFRTKKEAVNYLEENLGKSDFLKVVKVREVK